MDTAMDFQKFSHFVGNNVNSVCWMLESSIQPASKPTHFVTGGAGSTNNRIAVWQISKNESLDDSTTFHVEKLENVSVGASDVMDLKTVPNATTFGLLACSSNGSVLICSIDNSSRISIDSPIQLVNGPQTWACNCVDAVSSSDAIAGCENGKIYHISLGNGRIVRKIGSQEEAGVNDLSAIGRNEIVSGNMAGQLLLWDLRDSQPNVTACMPVNLTDHGALTSLDSCPSLKHLIVCGYQHGSIAFWDVRHPKIPAALIDAHKGPVWQVKFHPVYPDRIFTSSNDGEFWICDASKLRRPDFQMSFQGAAAAGAIGDGAGGGLKIPWLLGDSALKNAEYTELLGSFWAPINCFDVAADSLVCGTDAESVFIIDGIPL